jgi:hypothetical protein
MLFIRETHRVIGLHQDNFEDLVRDEWMPVVATDPGSRLLWYFNHAHGSSISFNVVTVTGVEDWDAWGRLQARVQSGDLQDLAHRMDQMRYGTVASIYEPLEWSPFQAAPLASIPTSSADHERTMYIEDTIQAGVGAVDGLPEAIRSAYRGNLDPALPGLTELAAAFRPVAVAGRRGEIVLLQRIRDLGDLARYYFDGEAGAGAPWSAAHALTPFTDTWSTRVLRAAPWSPLP